MGTTIGQELNEAYQHAQTGCVIVKRKALGYIWAHGHDRLDLLHRLSTMTCWECLQMKSSLLY